MQFWLGVGVTMFGVFAVGLIFGWWLRGKFVKNEIHAVALEMMEGIPDIWPGDRS